MLLSFGKIKSFCSIKISLCLAPKPQTHPTHFAKWAPLCTTPKALVECVNSLFIALKTLNPLFDPGWVPHPSPRTCWDSMTQLLLQTIVERQSSSEHWLFHTALFILNKINECLTWPLWRRSNGSDNTLCWSFITMAAILLTYDRYIQLFILQFCVVQDSRQSSVCPHP